MLKRTVPFALLLAVVVAGYLYFRHRTQRLPFSSAAWKAGNDLTRFQIKDSLLAFQTAGNLPDRAAVDTALGPDDNRSKDPAYRYYRLTEWDSNPWYLRIRFDDAGKVFDFRFSVD